MITDQEITNAGGLRGIGSPNPFTISDLSGVWIVCDVYENNLAIVCVGDTADIRLNAYPYKVLTGGIKTELLLGRLPVIFRCTITYLLNTIL